MISIDNLTKFYNRSKNPAIKDVRFQLNDGEILGMVGLNGAGKTTTLKIIAGVLKPTEGTVTVNGHNIFTEKEKAVKDVGWIPEFPNWEVNVKPMILMKYFAGFYGLRGKDAERVSLELLKLVGLSNSLDKKISTFSQGMKKRFAIAESLINNPQNILMDETLNGLDPEGIRLVRDLILDFKKQGKAIILSSHILAEVQNLADRFIFIHKGSVIKTFTRDEISKTSNYRIRLKVLNSNGELTGILRNYGEVIENNSYYEIMSPSLKIDEIHIIPEILVKNGYKIISFEPVSESLEQYFFRLIGEAK